MTNEIVKLLTSEGKVTKEQAEIIAPYIQLFDSEVEQAELEALIYERGIGKLPIVTSRHGRNLLINWRDVVLKAIPALVGAGVAIIEPVTGIIICLGAVYTLVQAADIPLSEKHGEVVLALWQARENVDPVTLSDLKTLVDQPPETLDMILKDLERLRVIKCDGEDIYKRDRFIAR